MTSKGAMVEEKIGLLQALKKAKAEYDKKTDKEYAEAQIRLHKELADKQREYRAMRRSAGKRKMEEEGFQVVNESMEGSAGSSSGVVKTPKRHKGHKGIPNSPHLCSRCGGSGSKASHAIVTDYL